MTTSSKGKAEKRRLHTYVTTTVLDKSWKGTTEQFILHFNEQFRQLDEVSPPEESLPYTTRLTLLQTAVHNIPELRMVETMEEFISLSSSTPGPTMGYDNYLTLLQNACIRYDSNLKSRPSPASRAAYQHDLSHDQHDNPYPQDYYSSGTTYGGIDMPAEEFYQVHTTNLNRPPNVSTITPRKSTSSPPRMVETMEEFISLSSSTPGPTMGYDNYHTLLQNACIRYDSYLKSRPSPASRPASQHDLSHDQHGNPYPQDYSSTGTTYGGIDMPAEEFYQVHTTNLNRPPNVSTITPRKPTTAPPTGRPTPRRSPRPIFLPANIYKLLSDVAIKELKKHNATTRYTPPPKRAVNTHGTDSHLEYPPLKLPQVIQPLQIPLQTLIWTTLNPVNPSPSMTPPLSTSWTPIPPLTLSIKPTSIMWLNTLLPIMDLLLIGEPVVDLLAQM